MYISQLELYGFKSFNKKTTFRFNPGISCIVGPNGCGKSNVIDAIRWVLGEQKASVLRSEKMGDVIFNGTEKHRPLSFAEVTLTIHNGEGELPLNYTDVEITRRLYRSGESEYLLNKVPVRLKDIINLFLDTGMGVNAYSVMELGMIESILSESQDERKKLFEEAAGVNKYRLQRRSALRKLEATQEDLTRLNDIILEVGNNVKQLKKQLNRLGRYEKYQQELKETEIQLATSRLFNLRKQMEPLRRELTPLQDCYLKSGNEVDTLENEIEHYTHEFNVQEEQLVKITGELDQVRKRRGKLFSNKLLWQEQLRNNEGNLERLATEKRTLKNRLEVLEQQRKEFEDLKAEIEPSLNQMKITLSREQEEFEKKFRPLYSREELLKEQRNAFLQISSQISSLESEVKHLRDNSNRIELKIQENQQKEKELERQSKEYRVELDQLFKELEQINYELGELDEKLTALKEEESEYRRRVENLNRELIQKKSEVESLQERITLYQSIIESRQGLSTGARYLLEHKTEIPGVIAPITDLLQASPDFVKALETSLLEFADIIVVETMAQALEIVQKMESWGKGGVKLLPLRSIPSVRISEVPEIKGVLARLSDSVITRPEYRNLVDLLFSNVLVVDEGSFDPSRGERISGSWNFVSRDGNYFIGGHFVRGGNRDTESTDISRREKIKAFSTRKDSLETEIELIQDEINEVMVKLAELESMKSSMTRERTILQDKLQEKKDRLSYLDNRANQSRQRITELQKELEIDRRRLQEIEERKKVVIAELDNLRQQKEQVAVELQKFEQQLMDMREEKEKERQHLQEQELELVRLDNELKNIIFRLNSVSENYEDYVRRLTEVETEEKTRQGLVEELQEKIAQNEVELKEVEAALEEVSSRRDEYQIVYNELRRELVSREDTLRRLRRERENLLEKIRDYELQLSELKAKEEQIVSRIKEKYGEDLSERELVPVEDEEKLERRIGKILKQLESIGSINMNVREDYERENGRYQFLKQQLEDLENARSDIQETIKKIDSIARKQFKEVFENIRNNFKQTFQMFFEGGEADLVLVGSSDPLEANVEIVSRPAGKRMQSLKMLSAGEKALTAIALLFAIYLVKPSPFCILDEVDAPLDDSNIGKFTRVLKKFSENTQFIVVTHNKMTMDAAHTLYGITMEEKGVSRVVTVRLA